MSDCSDLWEQYEITGDPDLRDEIIVRNIPLVHHILGRLAIPTLNEETYHDLVGQGILGLIDAVDRFEPQRGWRFSTYATLRVRGQILDALRAMDILPRAARKRVKGIERAISRLRMELCREPHEEEVAAAVDMNLKAYRGALVEANCAVVSIDAAVDDDGSDNTYSLQDLLCDQQAVDPEEALAEADLREQLSVALRQLPRRLQLLLSLYYFEGLTMKEIGQVLDLSESRVSQLHGRAMAHLRTVLEPEDAVPEGLSRFVPVSVLVAG